VKVRFELDQADALRRGVDIKERIVTVNFDPASIPAETRNLIADRLDGERVRPLRRRPGPNPSIDRDEKKHIRAKAATLEALIEAIKENDAEVRALGLVDISSGPKDTSPRPPFRIDPSDV
jgi:hypothetical protein